MICPYCCLPMMTYPNGAKCPSCRAEIGFDPGREVKVREPEQALTDECPKKEPQTAGEDAPEGVSGEEWLD